MFGKKNGTDVGNWESETREEGIKTKHLGKCMGTHSFLLYGIRALVVSHVCFVFALVIGRPFSIPLHPSHPFHPFPSLLPTPFPSLPFTSSHPFLPLDPWPSSIPSLTSLRALKSIRPLKALGTPFPPLHPSYLLPPLPSYHVAWVFPPMEGGNGWDEGWQLLTNKSKFGEGVWKNLKISLLFQIFPDPPPKFQTFVQKCHPSYQTIFLEKSLERISLPPFPTIAPPVHGGTGRAPPPKKPLGRTLKWKGCKTLEGREVVGRDRRMGRDRGWRRRDGKGRGWNKVRKGARRAGRTTKGHKKQSSFQNIFHMANFEREREKKKRVRDREKWKFHTHTQRDI